MVTTPSKELGKSGTTEKSKTTIALQQRANNAFLETVADIITSPNDSTEEDEPTSVMLLYRIGEALQAAENTSAYPKSGNPLVLSIMKQRLKMELHHLFSW